MSLELRKLIRLMIEADVTNPLPPATNASRVIRRKAGELNQRQTTAVPDPSLTEDPKETRKKKMDQTIREVAKSLRLADVRYLSRSARLYGAYTYSAVDERNENVVVKLQPIVEIEGYRKAQQVISRLPDRVARHLPIIYKVRTLDDLGISGPVDDFGYPEALGVIVMERLEELPGNMFDMITQPPTKSMQSLKSLLKDRAAFNDMIDEAIKKSERAIDAAISESPKRVDRDEEVERLRVMLRSASYSDEITDESGGMMLSATDGLSALIWEKTTLWCRGLGVTRSGRIDTVARTIIGSMSSLLGRRAVPREPSRDVAGPLGRLRGVRELVKAIEELKNMNIKPADVHGNNIMIRPETGELVLADLGHFT